MNTGGLGLRVTKIGTVAVATLEGAASSYAMTLNCKKEKVKKKKSKCLN